MELEVADSSSVTRPILCVFSMKIRKYKNLGVFKSNGRIYQEQIKYNFLEDKFRIINSKAFRRLEYKTQVFINYTGDHYRTRLTHSLEVSQIAVYIARELGLNEELAEVIALSHDIGHPPFGHAGEEALNEVAVKFGGFDHNIHGIRIITLLDKRSPKYNGLNLTIETIDGILKHNGVIRNHKYIDKLTKIIDNFPISFGNNASLESQIAALADDIAYTKHDIDDGIRAGFISIEELGELQIFKAINFNRIIKSTCGEREVQLKVLLSILSIFLIDNLLSNTMKNISANNINNIQDVYNCKKLIVEFSKTAKENLLELKNFLFKNVYKNHQVNLINYKTQTIVRDLFNHFMNNPKTLPKSWQRDISLNSDILLSEIVINYIAGMTDRFAITEHKNIFDLDLLSKTHF